MIVCLFVSVLEAEPKAFGHIGKGRALLFYTDLNIAIYLLWYLHYFTLSFELFSPQLIITYSLWEFHPLVYLKLLKEVGI